MQFEIGRSGILLYAVGSSWSRARQPSLRSGIHGKGRQHLRCVEHETVDADDLYFRLCQAIARRRHGQRHSELELLRWAPPLAGGGRLWRENTVWVPSSTLSTSLFASMRRISRFLWHGDTSEFSRIVGSPLGLGAGVSACCRICADGVDDVMDDPRPRARTFIRHVSGTLSSPCSSPRGVLEVPSGAPLRCG